MNKTNARSEMTYIRKVMRDIEVAMKSNDQENLIEAVRELAASSVNVAENLDVRL